MVVRYTGACMGLLAFGITVVAGLAVDNPPMVTLSRSVWALFIFCVLGLLLGTAAQAVINDHQRRREQMVLGPLTAQKENDGDVAKEKTGETVEGAPSGGPEIVAS